MSQRTTEEFTFPSFLDVTKLSWKQMLSIPLIFLVVNVSIFLWFKETTGDWVRYGIDFTGGSLISIPSSYELEPEQIQAELKAEFGLAELSVRKGGGVLNIETQTMADEILAYMEEKYGKTGTKTTLEVPLAQTFRKQAPMVLVVAFAGMAIIIYIVFRSPLPSIAVMLSAILDIVEAMSLMTLTGVRLSLATVAALLMLIGYAVDSNILLTTRLLKRAEDLRYRLLSAMKTGLTMTSTTLCALIGLYLFPTSDIVNDIALVLIFGLCADVLNTWFFNAGILRLYLERKFRLLHRRGRMG